MIAKSKIAMLAAVASLSVGVSSAFAFRLNENNIIQGRVAANTTPGVVVVCEFFKNFGDGCVTNKDYSDFIRFRQIKNPAGAILYVQVTMGSDDDGDLFGSGLADSVPPVFTGDKAISEDIFGNIRYTPGTSTDPGFVPGAPTQPTFSARDNAVPEPETWVLALTGLVAVGGALRARRRATIEALAAA